VAAPHIGTEESARACSKSTLRVAAPAIESSYRFVQEPTTDLDHTFYLAVASSPPRLAIEHFVR
jgi:hypothetical protein